MPSMPRGANLFLSEFLSKTYALAPNFCRWLMFGRLRVHNSWEVFSSRILVTQWFLTWFAIAIASAQKVVERPDSASIQRALSTGVLFLCSATPFFWGKELTVGVESQISSMPRPWRHSRIPFYCRIGVLWFLGLSVFRRSSCIPEILKSLQTYSSQSKFCPSTIVVYKHQEVTGAALRFLSYRSAQIRMYDFQWSRCAFATFRIGSSYKFSGGAGIAWKEYIVGLKVQARYHVVSKHQ